MAQRNIGKNGEGLSMVLKPLYDLLRTLYPLNESLLAFLANYPYKNIAELLDELPGTNVASSSFRTAVIRQIQAHGLDKAELFDELAKRFPARTAEIAQARQAYFEDDDFKQQVDSVVGGLERAHAQLEDPAVRAALATSKDSLTTLARDTTRLDIYKNLHECLHQLQMIPIRKLAVAAAALAAGQAPPVILTRYGTRLATAWTKASAFNQLPAGQMRVDEEDWINELKDAANKYKEALNAADIASTRSALEPIRDVLRFHPFRINRNIYLTALALPLGDLTAALTKVSAADPAMAGMSDAINSMKDLQATLLARVREHKMWQDADNKVWLAEEALGRKSPRANFAEAWPAAKSSIGPLLALESNEDWSEQAIRCSDGVADELADETGSDEKLEKAFDIYQNEVRRRFLDVDASLRSDCAALANIGAPLHAILAGLANG